MDFKACLRTMVEKDEYQDDEDDALAVQA